MTEQITAPAGHTSFLAAPPARAVRTPAPDDTWTLPGGTAWVFYGKGHTGLVRPVILSDGFNTGPTKVEEAWAHMQRPTEEGGFPFATELLAGGRDLIILGYTERSASILTNAETATAAIRQSIAERQGSAGLVVGGFSMGGLVTRYALARMERRRERHETAVYLSYDSPHRGAWIPIGLQAFAHFLAEVNPLLGGLSRQINSDAARQLLWQHIDTVRATPGEDDLRSTFIEALDSVGSWPQMPLKLGIASGAGNGVGNGVTAGKDALTVDDGDLVGTLVRAQSTGAEQLVARLRVEALNREIEVFTNGLPALDGAPGGTLRSFGIAADLLTLINNPATAHYENVCFVPTVSAAAIGHLDDPYRPVDSLPVEASELDDFVVARTNQAHSAITPDLANWILERLPE
ncbi:MAG: hypothetical protein ABW224_21075 [Kibdelosporangium sp.]